MDRKDRCLHSINVDNELNTGPVWIDLRQKANAEKGVVMIIS